MARNKKHYQYKVSQDFAAMSGAAASVAQGHLTLEEACKIWNTDREMVIWRLKSLWGITIDTSKIEGIYCPDCGRFKSHCDAMGHANPPAPWSKMGQAR